jgi:hypothetical protein
MSFSMTTQQVRDETKTVTRRMGWEFLKHGDHVQPVEKGMGLKPGEKVKKIGAPVWVERTRSEALRRMTDDLVYGQAECVKEGFPDLTPQQFVEMFCKSHKGCVPGTEITRIEFSYQDSP